MFKFLKEKLKGAVNKLSKDIDEQAEDIEEKPEDILEEVEEPVKEVKKEPEPKPKKKDKPELKEEKKVEPKKEETKPEPVKEEPKPKEELKVESLTEDVPEEVKEEVPDDLSETEKRLAADFEKEEKLEEKEEKKVEEKGFFGKIKDKFVKTAEEKPEEVLEVPEEEPKEEFKPEDIALPDEVKEAELPEPPTPEPEEKEEPEPIEEAPLPEPVEETKEEEQPKKGFFGKITESITKKKISESKFDDLFWEMEVALLENNVAVEVIEKIKNDLKTKIVDKKLTRGKIEEEILQSLGSSIAQLFDVETFDLISKVKEKKPYVIAFVGVNGSGKTTTIAKMIHMFQQNHLTCVVAASDTFRAAAIQQLEEHTDKLHVKLIKHDYGADPAAVAYDAIAHAKAKDIDVVFIDTAGRLHSNSNLMDEMKKIIRVAKPDMKIFIGESITGNDCVEQAKQFDAAVGIDAMILSKADVDEKGGAAISVSYVTGKPILYIGTGQEYSDLEKFDKNLILNGLGLQ